MNPSIHLNHLITDRQMNMLQAILSGDVEQLTKVKSHSNSHTKTHTGGADKASGKASSVGRNDNGMVGVTVPPGKDKGKGNTAFAKGVSVSSLLMQGTKNKTLIPLLANDDDEVLELEVMGDVDIHATNKLGHTALHVAAMKGHVAAIQLLLNYGSDIECRDRDGTKVTHSQNYLHILPLILCIPCMLLL